MMTGDDGPKARVSRQSNRGGHMRTTLNLMTAILALAGIVIGLAHALGGLVGYADFASNGDDLGDIAQAAGYLYHDSASRFLGGVSS
jgi:hypothetical protein